MTTTKVERILVAPYSTNNFSKSPLLVPDKTVELKNPMIYHQC